MRRRALGLSRALFAARDMAHRDRNVAVPNVENSMRDTLAARGVAIDYAAVRDAMTLMPIDTFQYPARALIAARVDHVRLIDNIALRLPNTKGLHRRDAEEDMNQK
jgi:pantothenate synthetase